jgi:hypothetical protein
MGKKDYKFTVRVEQIKNTDTDKNVTNCMNCKYPCHIGCSYSNNYEKINCCAMENGYCKCCPGKCTWKAHENSFQIA